MIFKLRVAVKLLYLTSNNEQIVMKSFFIPVIGFLIFTIVPDQGDCQVLLENRQQIIPLKHLASFDLEIYGTRRFYAVDCQKSC